MASRNHTQEDWIIFVWVARPCWEMEEQNFSSIIDTEVSLLCQDSDWGNENNKQVLKTAFWN